MKYKILQATSCDELAEQVEKHLAEQWKPQGGIESFTAPVPNAKLDKHGEYWGKFCLYFAQAVIREET